MIIVRSGVLFRVNATMKLYDEVLPSALWLLCAHIVLCRQILYKLQLKKTTTYIIHSVTSSLDTPG